MPTKYLPDCWKNIVNPNYARRGQGGSIIHPFNPSQNWFRQFCFSVVATKKNKIFLKSLGVLWSLIFFGHSLLNSSKLPQTPNDQHFFCNFKLNIMEWLYWLCFWSFWEVIVQSGWSFGFLIIVKDPWSFGHSLKEIVQVIG